jgi:uncharacterized protein YjbI with pentapeptide repeats
MITAALVYGFWSTAHVRAVAGPASDEDPRLGSGRVIDQLPGSQVPATARRFRYDETSGKCLDSEDREGYNRSSREELETTREAECADFRGPVNLTYLYLSKANLRGANFAGTRWYLGEITDSDLTGADLSSTNGQMDYRRSRLREANLSRADLNYADLADADLGGADLRGARFSINTRLPFDHDEALRRGMIFVGKP